MDREIKNAHITETMLGFEDHGIFTFGVVVEFDGGKQMFGTYQMGHKEGEYDTTTIIKNILRTIGVRTWEELLGKFCRIDAEHSKIHGIGHLIKDTWFYPEKDYENIKVGKK